MKKSKRVKFINQKIKEEIKKIAIDKVCAAWGLVTGWYYVNDDKRWVYIMNHWEKRKAIEFKKFWKDRGADMFAKWLWEHKYADGYEQKDGNITVWFANDKKENGLMCRKEKYKEWHKEFDEMQAKKI